MSMLAKTSRHSSSQRGRSCRGKVHFLQVLFGVLAWAGGLCAGVLSTSRRKPNLFFYSGF